MPLGIVRKPIFALAAAGAVGGPYWASNTETGRATIQTARGWIESAPSATPAFASDGMHAHHATETLYRYGYETPTLEQLESTGLRRLAGGPVADFRDVIRFDINPQWVSSHFSRVTTVLADTRLEGLRVPIVTGTDPTDVAGSLTYYFDHQHRVQRIVMQGFTGDPSRLSNLMRQFYRMNPEPTLDADVMVTRWNARITSVLKTTRAPIMYPDAARSQYTVFLELNQPGLAYGLSDTAAEIVRSDMAAGRV